MKKRLIITFLTTLLEFSLWSQGFTELAESLGLDYDFKTAEYGGGISFVDFNQDGLDDLTFASDSTSTIRFHINTGTGFREIEPLVNDQSEVKQVLWIDYDNDENLDLYLASKDRNRLYRNLGSLEMIEVTEEVGFNDPVLISYASTWMDYDQDGFLDLFVTHRTPEEAGWITLYKNMAGLYFEDFTTKSGLKSKGNSVLAMTSIDFNNDGWTDLFLAQDWEQGNQLLRNNGDGTFRDVSIQSYTDQKMNAMTATVGDFNADGWMDIYVSNTTEGNILLRNNGDETFKEISEEMGVNIRGLTFGSSFFDADNDGDLDLQVVGFKINYLFENKGSSEPFSRVDELWGFSSDTEFNNGLALGDFNQDGYVDLVRNCVTRTGFAESKNTFWRNDFSGNNYLTVNLIGTVSNRFAIGSTLIAYIHGQPMVRRIAAGESFASQHSYEQHFGLGNDEMLDSLVIKWSTGNLTVVKNVAANQRLELTEPQSGCTDLTACNYQSRATTENGNCRYAKAYMDCSGCLSDQDADGVCDELEVPGCTDIQSCNFSPLATENDGSCSYLPTYEILGNARSEPLTLEPYSYSSTEDSKFTWTISGGSIALGQGTASIQALWHGEGIGILSLIETDRDGCQSREVELKVVVESVLANEASEAHLEAYPNPSSGLFKINLPLSVHWAEVTVTDVSGAILVAQHKMNGSGPLDLGWLEDGIYMLQVRHAGVFLTKKICIRH